MRGFAVLAEGSHAGRGSKGALRAALLVWMVGRAWRGGGRFIAGDCGAHPWAPPQRALGARWGQPFGCPNLLPADSSNPRPRVSSTDSPPGKRKRRPIGRPFAFVWRREGEPIESALTPSSFRETQTGPMSCVVIRESNVVRCLLPSRSSSVGVGKFLSRYKFRSANIRRKQAVVTIRCRVPQGEQCTGVFR